MTKVAVTIAAWLMILAAIPLSLIYGLWIAGGWVMDRRERRPMAQPPTAACSAINHGSPSVGESAITRI